jgi:hypothetical protein
MAAENLAPTGIRSPDLPACSESLYPLSYPGPLATVTKHKLIKFKLKPNKIIMSAHFIKFRQS